MKTKWGSCNRETGHIWFGLNGMEEIRVRTP